MIAKYINQIRFRREWKKDFSDEYDQYTFYGDGEGDFEIGSEEVESFQLITDYIKYSEQQIKYARNFVKGDRNDK